MRIEEAALISLAAKASELYRVAQEVPKDDGTVRRTYDARRPLKEVHRLIKLEILDHVAFPEYLTGSIKGRDYKANAALHRGAKIVISEDIGQFFPSTTTAIVFDVWRHFFGFSVDVANCLAQLTTRHGELPQGAITSPQLANLVFWRDEPSLYARLAAKGIAYSRFVDDVSASSGSFIAPADKTAVIASIYGMMRQRGYKPKRAKHDIGTARNRMTVTKLTVNDKPGLARKERSKIRAMVHKLERDLNAGAEKASVIAALPTVTGKVSLLARFHPGEAKPLKIRLAAVKKTVDSLDRSTLE
jgi:hypothetical protein